MKILGFAVLFFIAVAAALLVAGQVGLLTGRTPKNLGVQDGRLKPPSQTPNSVSSQANLYPDHPQKDYALIAPFQFSGDGEKAMARIAEILKRTDRTVVVTQEPGYLYAQCTTKLLKFTDDIEFWLDKSAGVIHVRSASRLGQKDFNVNRERVESIRAQFTTN
ncbi:DUF1499 domain-containing protein [Rhodoferax saidenbachensis]|uniref:DUF1499 domain-containing protein n=1 Tax=Rhodoferax saidenbachensis TaxID=1484693 RepID=A0A1P8K941_9BURK|nr:DUF1499 domain-containing protein [Rhodoferax saidenbachensis]APW42528.1 hypothetical protein RS694_08280 [Rhodoferax saidenbachensis]